MARLKDKYLNEVVPAMVKKFGYTNIMQVPKIEKVVVNAGLGDVKDDAKKFQAVVEEIALITGQAPIVTKAKKSVANSKVPSPVLVRAVRPAICPLPVNETTPSS